MVRCEICGMEYGLAHNCPGKSAAMAVEESVAAPAGFVPLYYLREGWAIARWDDAAIRRISRDDRALAYGFAFFAVAQLLAYFVQVAMLWRPGLQLELPRVLLLSVLAVAVGTVWQVVRLGLCHLVAAKFLDGTGTFMGILRPLLLSSFLLFLVVIPFAGLIVAGLWWGLAVTLWVFEEVHQVDRLKTLGVLVAINFIFFLVQMYWPSHS